MAQSPKSPKKDSVPAFIAIGVGLTGASRSFLKYALPDCHFLNSALNSVEIAEICKLTGMTILIVDYESLLEIDKERPPFVEILSNKRLLVLCQRCDDEVCRMALAMGCSGVMTRDTPAEDLRRAIKAMSEGELWYPRAVLSALARGAISNIGKHQKKLTVRETEILRLLMDHKNQDIADQLFISRETVRWHLRALYAKLGVSGRAEARQHVLGKSEFAPGSARQDQVLKYPHFE